MKEIGGYMELEHYRMPMMHEGAVALNCGRNCLAYLIRAKNISKIVLPVYLCNVLVDTCILYNVAVRFCHVDEQFLPVDVELADDEWLYIVNYYGQLRKEEIEKLHYRYRRIIMDYAQAYFDISLPGVDSIYTCRKFFGVADGAFLYTDSIFEGTLEEDSSLDRMNFLMGRYEKSAAEFYWEFQNNEKKFEIMPVKTMSRLTKNLLRGIDYVWVKEQRTKNFEYLAWKLNKMNLLSVRIVAGAFAYPLMVENARELREKLIEKKIYVPVLWKDALERPEADEMDIRLAANILPLPCDHRYGKEEMAYICDVIKKYI